MVHTLPLFYFQRYCRLNHSVKISDGFPLSHVEYDSSLQLLISIYQFASFSRKHSLHLAFFFLFSFLFLFLSFFFTFIISSNQPLLLYSTHRLSVLVNQTILSTSITTPHIFYLLLIQRWYLLQLCIWFFCL